MNFYYAKWHVLFQLTCTTHTCRHAHTKWTEWSRSHLTGDSLWADKPGPLVATRENSVPGTRQTPWSRARNLQGYCLGHHYFSIGEVILTSSGVSHRQCLVHPLPRPSPCLQLRVLGRWIVRLETNLHLMGLQLTSTGSWVKCFNY